LGWLFAKDEEFLAIGSSGGLESEAAHCVAILPDRKFHLPRSLIQPIQRNRDRVELSMAGGRFV
jgi:hypothetical protein